MYSSLDVCFVYTICLIIIERVMTDWSLSNSLACVSMDFEIIDKVPFRCVRPNRIKMNESSFAQFEFYFASNRITFLI